MTTRLGPQKHPGARIPIMSGAVMVGAIFPPARDGDKWRWSLFQLGTRYTQTGEARSQDKATEAALARWREFLTEAELREVVS